MYLCVFLLGLILSFFYKKHTYLFYIYALLLFIIAIFRFGVGPDYFAYEYCFRILKSSFREEIISNLVEQELGFRFLGVLFKKGNLHFFIYIGFIAFINLFFVFKLIKKHAMNPLFALTMYYSMFYFVWTFSGLRQGMTIAIGVYYILEALKTKNHFKIVVISLLLSTIHVSSLVLLLLYCLSSIEWTQKRLTSVSILCVFFSFIPIHSIMLKMQWLPLVSKFINYVDSSGNILNSFNFASLARLCFLFFCLAFYNRLSIINKDVINVYIIGLCLYYLFKSSEIIASRLSIYGYFLSPVVLANICSLSREREQKVFLACILSALSCAYFVKEVNTMERYGGLRYAPYRIIAPYTHIFNRFEGYTFDVNPAFRVYSHFLSQ